MVESNQKPSRVNWDSGVSVIPGHAKREPGISRFSDVQLHIVVRCFASPRNDGLQHHCVFATLGGAAVVTKLVASSTAGPNGVGMVMRNGTRMRVPAIGTKAISILRWE